MVDAFVAEVATWEGVDLSTLSEFLVVAAVLIELKSRRLLPGRDDGDPDEELIGWEERDLLLARLLECQAYSAAADAFTLMMEYAGRSVPRQAGLDEGFAVHAPDLLEGITSNHLMAAYLRATAARPVPVVDLYHVTVDTVSVAEAVSELEVRLPREGTATFRGLTRHLTTRMEVIVQVPRTSRAVQAGTKDGILDQGHRFGELEVSWVTGAPTTVSVGAVDYEYEG